MRQHTFADHADEKWEYTYTFEELGEGNNRNLFWNATQYDMVRSGKIRLLFILMLVLQQISSYWRAMHTVQM